MCEALRERVVKANNCRYIRYKLDHDWAPKKKKKNLFKRLPKAWVNNIVTRRCVMNNVIHQSEGAGTPKQIRSWYSFVIELCLGISLVTQSPVRQAIHRGALLRRLIYNMPTHTHLVHLGQKKKTPRYAGGFASEREYRYMKLPSKGMKITATNSLACITLTRRGRRGIGKRHIAKMGDCMNHIVPSDSEEGAFIVAIRVPIGPWASRSRVSQTGRRGRRR